MVVKRFQMSPSGKAEGEGKTREGEVPDLAAVSAFNQMPGGTFPSEW